MKVHFARGKLLLTGEYSVLHGADALVLPVAYGQFLKYRCTDNNCIHWQAQSVDGEIWLSVKFNERFQIVEASHEEPARKLARILKRAFKIRNKAFQGFEAHTRLNFHRKWGLGSSSTLYYLVGCLFEISPMELFKACGEKGSGYDIAAACRKAPFIFSNKPELSMEEMALPEAFLDTYFVYLNKKQDSAREVRRFLKKEVREEQLQAISALTGQMVHAQSAAEIQNLMQEHEKVTANIIDQPTLKEQWFPDFEGSLKSLGAWGGDFIWACGSDVKEYFRAKGHHTIFKFAEMLPAVEAG